MRFETSSATHRLRRLRGACDRACYLPREVFFGRLGFAGAFFTVWAGDFVRFLPATSGSFPIGVLLGAPYRASPAPCAAGRLRLATVYDGAVHADLLETVGRNRPVRALIGLRAGAELVGVPCPPPTVNGADPASATGSTKAPSDLSHRRLRRFAGTSSTQTATLICSQGDLAPTNGNSALT